MKHVTGNLLDMAENGDFDIIVHGCNCMCTMGSGIAKQIRDRYPDVYRADQDSEPGSIHKLGNYTRGIAARNCPMFWVVNAYTQYEYNRRGETQDRFEYASFELILRKLAHQYGSERFGFPMIGMGLAGGDKQRIMGLLERFADDVERQGGTVTLVEFG